MPKFTIIRTIFFISTILQPMIAGAWGPTGHRVIGKIADRHLSPKAQKTIKQILEGESVAMVSTWMDEIRSDPAYNYTATWHWVTIEDGKTYKQNSKKGKGDIIATLERLIDALKRHTLRGVEEREALKMVIHLVGDIHQPLHVGCCDDHGGNDKRVSWFSRSTNLHHVWDVSMIDDTKLSYTEFAESLEPTIEKIIRQKEISISVRHWAEESKQWRNQVYATGNNKLGYPYMYKNMPLLKERLAQAGLRLSKVLNMIYG